MSTLALSGCHELWIQGFGEDPDDPEVHRVDGGASPGTASAGRAFTGRAVGELASRMTIKHAYVKTKSNRARFSGTFKSSLTSGPLASGQWHGRLRTVRNRATGRFTINGLILATFTDTTAGRACLSLRTKGSRKQNRRPSKASRSKLTVLGGEGGARTLRGAATARVRLKRDSSLRLRGRVSSRRGAERGLTSACEKLRKKFKLAPLPAD